MEFRHDDAPDFDTKSVGSTVSEAPTGVSTLSARLASLGFEDRLRPGIAEEPYEFASQSADDAGSSEEEVVELSEEQFLQELDNQEPAFQVQLMTCCEQAASGP